MPDKKEADEGFRRRIVLEARGLGVYGRIHRRFWWHRHLTEVRDEAERQLSFVKMLLLRDMRRLDIDEDRNGEILGWIEDHFSLHSEAEARRFQRVIRNLLGPEWSEKAITTETKTVYHVSEELRRYLRAEKNRPVRKEAMRRMKFRPVLKTKRRVTRAIQDKPRKGDSSKAMFEGEV
jgi:hypothetical protein